MLSKYWTVPKNKSRNLTLIRPVYGAAAPKEDASEASYIKSGFVKAAQAKIYLELALANDYSMDDIRTLFEGDLRSSIFHQ